MDEGTALRVLGAVSGITTGTGTPNKAFTSNVSISGKDSAGKPTYVVRAKAANYGADASALMALLGIALRFKVTAILGTQGEVVLV